MLHIFSVLCGACQEHRRVTTALQLSTQAAPTNCSSKLPEKTQKNATRHVNTVVMGWTTLAKPDPTFRLTRSSWLDFLIVLSGALSFWKPQISIHKQSIVISWLSMAQNLTLFPAILINQDDPIFWLTFHQLRNRKSQKVGVPPSGSLDTLG